MLDGFGCSSLNVSPSLSWPAAPASYAVTMFDPDAPSGSAWWHWTVVNLQSSTRSLGRGAACKLPPGALQGRTAFGTAIYGGPCPLKEDRPHRYRFIVWALKVQRAEFDGASSGATMGFNLHANALASSTITAIYGN